MELLRKFQIFEVNNSLNSRVFGAKEEFEDLNIDKPLVFKSSEGAMSSGVFLGSNNLEKNKSLDKVSRNVNYVEELKDFWRSRKHKNYLQESKNRKKFITQSFIPELDKDFKVLVFGEKYFIFSRPVRKNDFRASGSGFENYDYGSKCKIPEGLLIIARKYLENWTFRIYL